MTHRSEVRHDSSRGRAVQVFAGMYPERTGQAIVEDVGPERPESVTRTLTQRLGRDAEG
jgi:hypothetical protein